MTWVIGCQDRHGSERAAVLISLPEVGFTGPRTRSDWRLLAIDTGMARCYDGVGHLKSRQATKLGPGRHSSGELGALEGKISRRYWHR